MFLELLWKVLSRSPRENFKVYRVFQERGGVSSRSIVFENVRRKRFIEQSYFLDDPTIQTSHLYDALNAIRGLKFDMPLSIYDASWETEGASSIDEAIDKGVALTQQLLDKGTSAHLLFPEAGKKKLKTLRAHVTIKEKSVKDVSIEERIRQLSSDLHRKAGGKSVYWKSIGSTPAGRQCQLLVIE